MNRNGILSILVLVCFFLSMGTLFATGDIEKKVVTIKVWTFLNPEGSSPREKALRQIMDRFAETNPDIKIEVQPQPWQELYTLFLAAAETDSAPDIIWLNKATANQRPDLLADLDKLIFDNWPKKEKDAFQPALWKFGKLGGTAQKAVAIWPTAAQVLYCRSDLLKSAGATTIQSWDDFRSVMAKLKASGESGGKYYGFGMAIGGGTSPGAFDSALTDLKGELFNPSTKLPNWNTPEGVQCLEYFTDLVKERIMPVDVVSQTVDDLGEAFAGGQFATMSGIAARYSSIKAKATWGAENMDFQSFPAWKAADYPGPVEVVSWLLGIWSDSKHPEEAAKFLEAMIDEKGAMTWILVGGQNPMRSTLASNPDFQDPKYASVKKMADIVNKAGFLIPSDVLYSSPAREVINKAFASVIVKGTDPAAAVREAEEEYKKLLK